MKLTACKSLLWKNMGKTNDFVWQFAYDSHQKSNRVTTQKIKVLELIHIKAYAQQNFPQ